MIFDHNRNHRTYNAVLSIIVIEISIYIFFINNNLNIFKYYLLIKIYI